jgi:hypothetical protein
LSNSANGVLETLIDFLQWFFVHQSIRIDRWTTWDNYGLWDPGHSNLILEKQPISESSGEIYHGSTVIWGYCIKKKNWCVPSSSNHIRALRDQIRPPDCLSSGLKSTSPWSLALIRWQIAKG